MLFCLLLFLLKDEIIVRAGSYYGKPNKPVYLSNVQCNGDEETLDDCTQTTYSLEEGKSKLSSVNVAGVKCGVSDNCVTPPTGGMDCNDGSVRLVGGGSNNEGILEYCHGGLWSPFCSLNQTEATVACRNLGYTHTKCMQIYYTFIKHSIIIYYNYLVVSIFDNGRFNELPLLTAYTSYIENITCTTDKGVDLSVCHIIDGCEVSCKYPIAIKCFGKYYSYYYCLLLSPKISHCGRLYNTESCFNAKYLLLCSSRV